MLLRTLVLGVLCVALMASPGMAQEAADEEQAAVLFERARDAYRQGEFERAEVLLREAISAADVPALHYNLARTLHELGRWQEAIEQYRLFLEGSPESPETPRVQARIALLEERIAAAALAASEAEPDIGAAIDAPAPPSAVVSGESARGPSPWPWVVAGLGVAAIGGGVAFGVSSQSAVDAARAAPDQVRADELRRLAQGRATTANAFYIAGGVLAAVGLIWGIVDVGTRPGDGAQPTVVADAHGFGVRF